MSTFYAYEKLKERFEILMSKYEIGDTIIALHQINPIGEWEHVCNYKKQILYNESLHSLFKNMKFEIVLEIFQIDSNL
jgi:hypothetical protein